MKVFLMSLAVLMSTAVMADEPLKVWNYENLKGIRLSSANGSKASMRISPNIKTPVGMKVLELTLDELNPKSVAWDIQLKYECDTSLTAKHSYEISFLCKASQEGVMSLVAALNQKPWTTISGGTRQFSITQEWKTTTIVFTPRKNWSGHLALPRIMLATYGAKAKLYFGPVTVKDLTRKQGVKKEENLIFNSSFELGMAGYNCARYLYPKNNPEMKYIKPELDKSTFVSGKQSLKIPNPFAEEIHLYPREVYLEPGMPYTLSFWAKSDKDKTPVNIYFLASSAKSNSKWSGHSRTYTTGTDWKRISFSFKTKADAALNPYLLYIGNGKGLNTVPCTLWLDDIQLDQGSANPYKVVAGLECVTIPAENYIISDSGQGRVPTTFRIQNNSPKGVKTTVLVTATDDYYQKTAFSKQLDVSLKPGEVKEFKFDIIAKSFGSYEVDAKLENPEGIKFRSHPGGFAVVGKYQRKPIDLDKTFCLSFNGPAPYIFSKLHTSKPGIFRGLGCGQEEYVRRLSIMGCRLLRDWISRPSLFGWDLVERTEGKFDFSYADMVTDLYARYGIALLPILNAKFNHVEKPASWRYPEPEWMIQMRKNAEKVEGMSDQKKKTDYRRLPVDKWNAYVKAVVKHFKGRVTHYEIINEPNLFMPSAEFYMEYLKPAFEIIRKTDPDAKVIGFCTTGDKGKNVEGFLEKCFALGGLNYADIASWHPYFARELSSKIPADKQIQEIFALIKKHGKPGMPLWNTEAYYLYGTEWASIPPYKPHHAARRLFTDMGEGVAQSIPVEEHTVWKDLITPNFKFHHFLIPAIEYLPTDNYVFYNFFARFFEGAKPIGKYRWGSSAICYAFERDGEFLVACWDYRNKTSWKATLPGNAGKVKLYDLFGNNVAFDGKTIKLGVAPYILKWKNSTRQKVCNELTKAVIQGQKEFAIERGAFLKSSNPPEKASVILGIRNMSNEQVENVNISLFSTGLHQIIACADNVSLTPLGFQIVNLSVKNQNIEEPGKLRVDILGGKKPFSQSGEDFTVNELLQLNAGVKSPVFEIKKHANGKPESSQDLSASVSIQRKGTELVLHVKVCDDKRGDVSKRGLWNEDSLQIYLDAFPMSGANYPEYSDTTYKILISASRNGKDYIESSNFPGKVRADITSTDDGYNATVTIPFSGIPGLKKLQGKLIGFDISINDSDAKSRKSEIVWHGYQKQL